MLQVAVDSIPGSDYLIVGDHAEIQPRRTFHDWAFIVCASLDSVNSTASNDEFTSDRDNIEVGDGYLIRIESVRNENYDTLWTDPTSHAILNGIACSSVGFGGVGFGQWHVAPG
jgi:hypothetical protein